MKENLKKKIDECIERYEFHGVAGVTENGETCAFCASGFEDDGKLFNKNTRFFIGGLTSVFTVWTAMLLSQQGRLDLKTHVSAFFPELKRYPDLTAEKLVTGESGLDDYYMSRGLSVFEDYKQGKMSEEEYVVAYEKISATDPSLEEVIGFLARSEIREDPDNNIFSPTDAFLLGEIIVSVTGKNLGDVFEEMIFRPLGMKNTSFEGKSQLWYTRYENGDKILVGERSGKCGCSGIITDYSDIEIWVRELIEGKLLDKKSRAFLFKFKKSKVWRSVFSKEGEWLSVSDFGGVIKFNLKRKIAVVLLFDVLIKYIENVNGSYDRFITDMTAITEAELIPPAKLRMEKLNEDNGWAALDIRLNESQKNFVSSPQTTLAIASIVKNYKPFVLKDGNRIIGLVVLEVNKKENSYWIAFFMIDKFYQGKGYGKKFIAMCCDYLAGLGAQKIGIAFYFRNIAAEKTYSACGFRKISSFRNATVMEYTVKKEVKTHL